MPISSEPTNYRYDQNLFERAARLYEVEANAARHYESLRLQTTSVVVIGTGALVAFGLDGDQNWPIAIVLVGVALTAFLISKRLGQAHSYHWHLSIKMRQILARGHPKLTHKYRLTNRLYLKRVGCWRYLDHERMWEWINLLVPLTGALLITLLANSG